MWSDRFIHITIMIMVFISCIHIIFSVFKLLIIFLEWVCTISEFNSMLKLFHCKLKFILSLYKYRTFSIQKILHLYTDLNVHVFLMFFQVDGSNKSIHKEVAALTSSPAGLHEPTPRGDQDVRQRVFLGTLKTNPIIVALPKKSPSACDKAATLSYRIVKLYRSKRKLKTPFCSFHVISY